MGRSTGKIQQRSVQYKAHNQKGRGIEIGTIDRYGTMRRKKIEEEEA